MFQQLTLHRPFPPNPDRSYLRCPPASSDHTIETRNRSPRNNLLDCHDYGDVLKAARGKDRLAPSFSGPHMYTGWIITLADVHLATLPLCRDSRRIFAATILDSLVIPGTGGLVLTTFNFSGD